MNGDWFRQMAFLCMQDHYYMLMNERTKFESLYMCCAIGQDTSFALIMPLLTQVNGWALVNTMMR